MTEAEILSSAKPRDGHKSHEGKSMIIGVPSSRDLFLFVCSAAIGLPGSRRGQIGASAHSICVGIRIRRRAGNGVSVRRPLGKH